MKSLVTYLTFNGNCAEAMKFYQAALKADLRMMPFSEMPGEVKPETKDLIMHASLSKGNATLMASDAMPGHPFQRGNNFSISIDCESKQEVDELYKALGQGGKATMPANETFWGAYFGMLTDRFGVGWMFNYDLPAKN